MEGEGNRRGRVRLRHSKWTGQCLDPTLKLEVGDEVFVGRDGVDTPPSPQVPDVHCVIITTSGHVVPVQRERGVQPVQHS